MTTNGEATAYLTSLLNKTLRIHTTDTRMFVGQMRCTDKERNIILSLTHEYRHPSKSAVAQAAREAEEAGQQAPVRVDMIKRFVGLVVVPGRYISKIELE